MSSHTDLEKTKFAAFYYLGKRRLTKKQLVDKLSQKEYAEGNIDEVLEYLEEAKYIDDVDYARCYIIDAINLKKHGKTRIKNDLWQKGISAEIVEKIFEEEQDELDEINNDALKELVAIKMKNTDITVPKEKNRLVNFLLRRGYNFEEIFSELRKYGDDQWD